MRLRKADTQQKENKESMQNDMSFYLLLEIAVRIMEKSYRYQNKTTETFCTSIISTIEQIWNLYNKNII